MIYHSGRAALYVSKRLANVAWTMDSGPDWASVTFGHGEEAITVYLIYILSKKPDNWVIPLTEIRAKAP